MLASPVLTINCLQSAESVLQADSGGSLMTRAVGYLRQRLKTSVWQLKMYNITMQ